MSTSHPREVLGGQWRNGQWHSEDNAVDVPRRLTMGGVAFHLCYITEEEKRVLHRLYSMRDLPAPAGLEFVTERESGDIEVDSSDAVAKAPKAWISEPSHAKSLLVYVDDPTAAILKRLDLHGSGVDKHDHFGPDRIPSYQGDGGDGSSDGGGAAGGDGGGTGDGGGGGGPSDPPYIPPTVTPAAPVVPKYDPNSPTPWTSLGVNTQAGYNTLMAAQNPGTTGQQKGDLYNTLLGQGFNDSQIRSSADTVFGKQSDSDWSQLAQYAGMQSPTGRPLAGSAQFYQPVYNSSYQNYNTGNATNVSQYGQQQPAQQPSMFGGQMQGGGYGAYGMNNPFSPYSNSFLNIDQNINQGTQADKANMYRNAIQSGFGDQQIRNQATGLFGQQTPRDWGYLQGYAMGMTPGLAQQSEQDKIGFYQNARNQGFNDQTIRNAANQMIGNQTQSDWSYLQNKAGYGGGGYGNQFMPQMQNPFSYHPQQQMQSPFSYQPVQQQMQTPFSYQQSGYPSQPQPVYEYGRGVPQQSQTGYGYNQPSAMTPRAPVQPPVSRPGYGYNQPIPPSYGGASSQSIPQSYYGYGQPIGSSLPFPAVYNQPVAPTYEGSYGTQLAAYTAPVSDYKATPMPQYVSDTISDLDQYKSQPVQAYQPPAAKSSGPRQAIVGRSSQSRGTPNVMRRAKGGIMSLMDDDE